MTYSIYGRMSLTSDWYCVKTKVFGGRVKELLEFYHKTWRYLEVREEC